MVDTQSTGSSSEKILLAVDEADVKCSVCWSTPSWQVFTCDGGHVTCHLCRARGVLNCPVCKQETYRNMHAEKMLHEMTIECPFDGCEVKVKQDRMKEHIDVCAFQPEKKIVSAAGDRNLPTRGSATSSGNQSGEVSQESSQEEHFIDEPADESSSSEEDDYENDPDYRMDIEYVFSSSSDEDFY